MGGDERAAEDARAWVQGLTLGRLEGLVGQDGPLVETMQRVDEGGVYLPFFDVTLPDGRAVRVAFEAFGR